MRKFLILGCAAAMLLQASCGGSGNSTSASKSNVKNPIVVVESKKTGELRPPKEKIFTETPANKAIRNEKFTAAASEFFVSPDVFSPAGNGGLGGAQGKSAKKAGFPGFPGIGKKAEPSPLPPPPAAKKKKEKTAKKKGFKVTPFVKPGFNPAEMKNKPDPSRFIFNGKTIEEWIREIPSKDKSRSENAIRAVLRFGPQRAQPAAPVILAVLKKHTTYRSLDASVRVNCVIALGTLLAKENEPDVRVVKAAVPVLTRMLRDSQVLVKYRAAHALSQIGPAASYAIPTLSKVVYDRSTWEVRQAAALALGSVAFRENQGPLPNVLNALYGPLKIDTARQVRLAAIQSLVFLGRPDLPANRAILHKHIAEVAYTDPDETVQIWAHMAVMNIEDKPSPDRLRLIAGKIGSTEVAVRIQAVRALWAMGLDAKSEIPSLIGALEDREHSVIYWSMIALSRLGRLPQEALPRLEAIAVDKKLPERLRELARHTSNSIQGKKVEKKQEKK